MTRIVTSTYRYKRPPQKRKTVPLQGAGDRAERHSGLFSFNPDTLPRCWAAVASGEEAARPRGKVAAIAANYRRDYPDSTIPV